MRSRVTAGKKAGKEVRRPEETAARQAAGLTGYRAGDHLAARA
jgi:hypothetical protein